MRAHPVLIGVFVGLTLLAVVWAALPPSAETREATMAAMQIPDSFQNLQVLPKDIEKRALINQMRGMAIGLGVRCWHCHKGEGDDFSTYEFADDGKPAKATARKMLRMVMAINQEHLAGLDAETRKGLKVTCITCHQKHETPPEP